MLVFLAQTFPTTLQVSTSATTSDLQLVVQLYDSAVTRIEWFVAVCLALVGIAVPIGVTVFSRIRINAIKRGSDKALIALKEEFATQLQSMKKENNEAFAKLVAELKMQLTDHISAEVKRVNSKLAVTEAGVFHVQGNSLRQSLPGYAWTSFVQAADAYIAGNAWGGLGKAIDLAIADLERSNAKIIEHVDASTAVEELIEKLNNLDAHNAFEERIRQLKRAFAAAKIRPEPTPETK